MSESGKQEIGTIGWIDLTTEDAKRVRDFYQEVVGWKTSDVEMGEYNDFNISTPETGEPVAGVCHARGSNAQMPPQWMIYITVENLDHSARRCTNLGGRLVVQPKPMGSFGRYCVIEDPAGAVAALFEPA